MDHTSLRKVQLTDTELIYCLERKNVKNLNLRIRTDGTVYVSANKQVPIFEIEAFIVSKGAYILKTIEKFRELGRHQSEPKQYVSGETFYILGRALRLQIIPAKRDDIVTDGVYIKLFTKTPDDLEAKKRKIIRYLDQQCVLVFSEILNELYPIFAKYGIEIPKLRIRNMETRWGSCLVKKCIITLNKRLLAAPRNCIEYVVMHELCHLIHPNHSKQFYDFLTMLMPDWKERKRILDLNAGCWL